MQLCHCVNDVLGKVFINVKRTCFIIRSNCRVCWTKAWCIWNLIVINEFSQKWLKNCRELWLQRWNAVHVKLLLSTPWMRIRGEEVQLHSFLTSAVVDAAILPQGKSPVTHWIGDCFGFRSGRDGFWWSVNLLRVPKFEPWAAQPVYGHYTDYNIWAPVSIEYEVCPERIQPYLISREPVAWPWCNLAASQRRPYCASVKKHSPVGLVSR
jgi:hypothetical protein